ncbi:hypothetical protein KYB31_12460 [Clostridium felsineum]|uniref:hypothetical protein n=1 Tax=Clostridium felsineum TaxID=36839 RepID=UPI00214DE483|nr:hypothetical protein [Clostridium felsineum]MCR3759785.1 hypothetical protein [Clostridium felsineum]
MAEKIKNIAYKFGISYMQEGKRFTSVCLFCASEAGNFYLTPEHKKYKNVYNCIKC